ncbi:MAG: hypothetical protein B5766_12945 [Candidatus Lumbricidophila eiseniae]|uniref:Phage tail protein n=1 Tax=Candidatus Lumbricidiphila eiseniae TaxID=1969409 RepID=A0A2A6FP12_9MICO|nr:MAG: hypothetical protein B5766_12945 [Candidatus Lumbricidophila eiseniae]
MAGNTVVVSITGNAKSLQNALGESENGLAKFAKIAGAVSAAVTVAVGAISIKAVKAASGLEQALGGMSSVFGDSAGQMEKWATTAAASVGLAKSEYASLSTVLGAQLKNMGVATDQLASQTDKLVGLGADLAAQFGGSTSDAVSALSSLLRGERDPIERYGVSINEAAVTAKMAAMGLSGLSGEAQKNAKLQATLALLFQQTADAQGAFSRESTTLAGAQQRLGAGTQNLVATLGTGLLPAVTAVTAAIGTLVTRMQESAGFQAFTGHITTMSNAFADFVFSVLNGTAHIDFGDIFKGLWAGAVAGIQKAAQWLEGGGASMIMDAIAATRATIFDAASKVFPAILDALVRAIPEIISGLVVLVTQLTQLLVTQVPILLAGAAQLFQGLLGGLTQVVPALLSGIIALIPPILDTLLKIIPPLLDTAIEVFSSLIESLRLIAPPLVTAIVDLLPKIVEALLGLIPPLIDAAIELFNALVEALPIILPLLINAIMDLLPKILGTVIGMLPKLLDAAVKLFTGIVDAIPKILPQLMGALIELAPKMVGTLIGMVPQLVGAGINLIGGLVSGLFRAAGSVGSALLKIAGDAVKGFLNFLGIRSPSKLFAGYGKNLIQGLVTGLEQNGFLVDDSLDAIAARIEAFDPTLGAPTREFIGTVTGSVEGRTVTYNIYVTALTPSPEIGRIIVQAIRDYEDAGGRL